MSDFFELLIFLLVMFIGRRLFRSRQREAPPRREPAPRRRQAPAPRPAPTGGRDELGRGSAAPQSGPPAGIPDLADRFPWLEDELGGPEDEVPEWVGERPWRGPVERPSSETEVAGQPRAGETSLERAGFALEETPLTEVFSSEGPGDVAAREIQLAEEEISMLSGVRPESTRQREMRKLLARPQSLRELLLLREILGPPLGARRHRPGQGAPRVEKEHERR